jgi:hypothetical protein
MQVVANNMAVQGVQNFANSVAMASSAMSGASSAAAGSIGFVGTVASLGVQLGVALGVLAVVVGSMPSVVGATPKAMRLKRLLALLEDDSNINRWNDRSSNLFPKPRIAGVNPITAFTAPPMVNSTHIRQNLQRYSLASHK